MSCLSLPSSAIIFVSKIMLISVDSSWTWKPSALDTKFYLIEIPSSPSLVLFVVCGGGYCCCFCFPFCLSRKGGGQALTPEHSADTVSFGSQQRALPDHLTLLSSTSATFFIFRHRRELDYWDELLVNIGKRGY